MELYKPRIRTLSQIVDNADFFFQDKPSYNEEAVNEFLKRDYVGSLLDKVEERLEKLTIFTIPRRLKKPYENLPKN